METEKPMRIFCKANQALNAAVRGDKVLLVAADPSDKSQHWIQDYSAIGKLTDDQGRRAFALVNSATGQALLCRNKKDVQLVPYRGHECVKVTMLWSLGVKLDEGFSQVRMLTNMSLSLNGLGGNPIKERTEVGVHMSEPKYDHTIWKIVSIM